MDNSLFPSPIDHLSAPPVRGDEGVTAVTRIGERELSVGGSASEQAQFVQKPNGFTNTISSMFSEVRPNMISIVSIQADASVAPGGNRLTASAMKNSSWTIAECYGSRSNFWYPGSGRSKKFTTW